MQRDYAKRSYIESRKKPANKKWLVVTLIFLMIMAGSTFYVAKKAAMTPALFFTQIKSFFQKPVKASAKSIPQKIPEPVVQFSFYNELPKMHVEVLPDEMTAKGAPPPIQEAQVKTTVHAAKPAVEEGSSSTNAADTSYFLQFGEFKDASAASQMRVSLLLSGIETEVEKIEGTQRYRVWQGAFATQAEAKTYQARWQKKGVDSVIKQDG